MEFLFVEEQPMTGRESLVGPGHHGRPRGLRPRAGRSRGVAAATRPSARSTRSSAIEDLGSTNGTFVNDVRVDRYPGAVPGDECGSATPSGASRAPRTAQVADATVHSPGAERPRSTDAERSRSRAHRPADGNSIRGRAGRAPVFDAARPPRRILGASAARRMEATLACYVVIVGTACGVVAFFVQR